MCAVNEQPVKQVSASLETLPADVLEIIFQLVGKHEILDLCCVSKSCSYTASKLLYKKILFVNENDFGDLDDQEPFWPWFQCTVTRISLMESLVDTLRDNPKLAGMIESMNVADTNEIYLLPELLSYTRLKYFHCSDILQIPRKSLDSVYRLSCCVLSACVEAPRVTELKLFHPLNGVGSVHYKNLSSLMISLGSYLKLRKLCFEVTNWNDFSYLCVQSCETLCWEYFFTFFNNHKLQLSSLSIEGRFIDSFTVKRAANLMAGVNLAVLSTLELFLVGYDPNEHVDWLERTSYHSTQFLEVIAPELTGLTTLSMRFEVTIQENVEKDFETLTKILTRYFKNQLKLFGVTFRPRCLHSMKPLQKAVLQTQACLEKLQINSDDMHELIYDSDFVEAKDTREDLVSRIMHSIIDCEQKPPFWPPWYIKRVRGNISQITDMMREDLIFENAKHKLPLLDEYHRDGVLISVKREGAIVNGILIPFDKPWRPL